MTSTGHDRTVGGLLRTLRRAAGLSQEELAERAGLSAEAISAIERGTRRRPHPHTLRALASALDLPAADRASLFGAAGTGAAGAAGPAAEPVQGVAALLPTAPQLRYSLPADTVTFTGRDGELGQIMAAVAGAASAGGVVAIAAIGGMPGVGKTALAVHAAHALAAEFPDRRLFIDLHAHTPGHEPMRPEDALAGLLAGVGVEPRCLPGDLQERAALWRDRMAGQRGLLVLDNAASSRQVAPLLPGGGCLVLVTSRRHLGDLPGAVTQMPLDVMTPQEAADMFIRLAPRGAGDRDGVARVVAMAEFLPLAVRLLARVFARHPSWALADLAGETRRGVLTLAVENDSVAAAFEVSYRHLDPDSQRLFRLLGVCPGTVIDSCAAAALAGIRQEEAAGLLDGLHREGLVTEAGYRRYGMHDLLRRYARDVAAGTSTADGPAAGGQAPTSEAQAPTSEGQAPAAGGQALGRLLDYYQYAAGLAEERLAHQVRPGPRPSAPAAFDVPALQDATAALAWIRADRASLLACLDLAARTGQHDRVVALTAGLAALLRRDGPWTEAVARHITAIDAARHLGDRLGEANALTDLGDVWEVTNDYPGAARVLEEALGIYRDLGNRLGHANALRALGELRRLTGDYPAADQALQQALSIYRDLGDRQGEAEALNERGTLHRDCGGLDRARECHQQALGLARAIGSIRDQAHALAGLGRCAMVTGGITEAEDLLRQAHQLFQRIGAAETSDVLALVSRPGPG